MDTDGTSPDLVRPSAAEQPPPPEVWENILDAIPACVMVYDDRGNPVRANQAAVQMCGFDPAAASHARLIRRLSFRNADGKPVRVRDFPVSRVLRGEIVKDERFLIRDARGADHHIVASAALIQGGEGAAVRIVSIWSDTTGLEQFASQARQAARTAQQMLVLSDAIFNSLLDAVIVYDRDGIAQQANPLAVAMLGFDPLRLPFARVFSRVTEIREDGTPFTLEETPTARARQGETVLNLPMTLTNIYGRTYSVLASASPLYIGKEVFGTVTFFHDKTDREHLLDQARRSAAEARLRAVEAETGKRILDALMEYIPEGITIADTPDVAIRMMSKHGVELAGRSPDEYENMTVLENPDFWQVYSLDRQTQIPPEDLPLSRAVLKGEIIENEEWILKRKNNEQIFILCNAGPIRDVEGNITGGVIAWRDITQLKTAEAMTNAYAEQLQRANQELQDFIFIASHDLQEPLRKVKSFSEMLKSQYGDALQGAGQEHLTRLLEATRRMQEMLNGLLTYSSISSKPDPFTPVDLAQVVQEVCSDLEVRIEQSHGQVVCDILPTVEAIPLQMRQLLQNLISNALKFRKPEIDPVVRVWAEERADPETGTDLVDLCVEDNGIGFDQEFRERIFQPFVRLHGRSVYEGTGMGLAICQKIAKRHGGRISATSQPGQGAKFIVSIPKHPKVTNGLIDVPLVHST